MPDLNSEKTGPVEDLDYKLIDAVGKGDEEAFERLINRYRDPILNFIYRYLGDRFGAEDLAQEVFLRVFEAAARFEPRGKVSTWIFRIAYNLAVNEKTRRSRMCPAPGGVEELSAGAEATGQVEGRELREEMMDLIGRLPEQQKAALLLRVNEELSYAEIAVVLSTSVSSVESLIYRARENLKKMIGRQREDRH